MVLLVADLASGDGAVLAGRGEYATDAAARSPREDALVQHREEFPPQGAMTCTIARAERLRGLMHPRERIARAPRITCRSTVPEQKPQ
jgi:hypothetical protein